MKASIIIPTYRGAHRIAACLSAVQAEIATSAHDCEVIVVIDGASDDTAEVVQRRFPDCRVLIQPNAGPAVARNTGAAAASGEILLFTDDDCVPRPGWLTAMLKPLEDPVVVGCKGRYETNQAGLVPRFVQAEYEDKYDKLREFPNIDFIDTYSAAFRRDVFLRSGGYSPIFRTACAEDVELSYRLAAEGCQMRFAPDAVVGHTHPASLWDYLRKKWKFAHWRVLAVRLHPGKAIRDSHTPQLMKLQVLFPPALATLALAAALGVAPWALFGSSALAFFGSTIPFVRKCAGRSLALAFAAPAFLFLRSCAQLSGLTTGVLTFAWRSPAGQKPDPAPTGTL